MGCAWAFDLPMKAHIERGCGLTATGVAPESFGTITATPHGERMVPNEHRKPTQ